MLLCKDCEHYIPEPAGSNNPTWARCAALEGACSDEWKRFIPIIGEEEALKHRETEHAFCHIERRSELYGDNARCGTEARLFEPKKSA